MNLKTGIAIPVRLDSQRFPRKPLAKISNLTMIEHVWHRANLCKDAYEVAVITPDLEIYDLLKSLGAYVLLSKKEHPNGTSRVSEFVEQLNWDQFLILQGDEPLILPEHLEMLIKFTSVKNVEVVNVISSLKWEDLEDQNIVKCILSKDNTLDFLFRRNPLVGRLETIPNQFAKVNGLYVISRRMLKKYNKIELKVLERSQSIEQYRYLENDITIHGLKIERDDYSVNTENELAKAIDAFRNPIQVEIANAYKI